MYVKKIRKKSWQTTAYLAAVLFSILFIVVGNRIAVSGMGYLEEDKSAEPLKAEVIRIYTSNKSEIDLGGGTLLERKETVFEARFLNGERKDEIVLASQFNDEFTRMDDVKAGDRVLLYPSVNKDDKTPWTMGDFLRTDWLMLLGGVFLLLLVIFGRKKESTLYCH